MVELVGWGFDLDYVLDLDVESFDILVERMIEVRASYRIQNLWSRFAGAQGTKQSIQKMAASMNPQSRGAKTKRQPDLKKGRSKRGS